MRREELENQDMRTTVGKPKEKGPLGKLDIERRMILK
jgi:hypothetical protein